MSRVWTWTIATFWALTMGFLIREKVMPDLLNTWFPTYQTPFAQGLKEGRTQMGIFMPGQINESRIGTSRTIIEELAATSATDPAWAIRNETRVDLGSILAQIGSDLQIETQTLLDSKFHLRSYLVLIRTGGLRFSVNVIVRSESMLEVQLQMPSGETTKKEIPFDNSTTLSNGLAPYLGTPKLRIGREWSIQQMDPMSFIFKGEIKTKPLLARVEKLEIIQVQGKAEEAFVISLRNDRYEAMVWMSEDGEVLQERVPFNAGLSLVMRREAWTDPR